jgi:hypothetical protein
LRTFSTATNAELAAQLGWTINRVTPRILELRTMGLVLDTGRRTCTITRSSAHAWKAKEPVLPPAVQEEAARSTEKVNKQQLLFAA